MASTSDDEDLVVLVVTDPSAATKEKVPQEEGIDVIDEISISVSEIQNWDVPVILRSPVIKVQTNPSRLVQQSSYFRSLLQGSFSEASLKQVSIQWNLETVVDVLQFIYGRSVNVTLTNFLLLLEGALFFGVEGVLSECEAWFLKITFCEVQHPLPIPVDTITEIWNFVIEHDIDSVVELCSSYLSRNFVQVLSYSSFAAIPYDLLYSCIEHPQLTVNSESQLCEALLTWLLNNERKLDYFRDSGKDYFSILKKVRTRLLPLGYAAGKRRSKYLSDIADNSVSAILDLVKDHTSLLDSIDSEFQNFRIRLTQYSEKIELQGCVQLKVPHLFLAVLPYNMDSKLKKRIILALIEIDHRRGDYSQISQEFTMLSFDGVQHVDMSRCPMLQFGAVIKFLHTAFPSLRVLKLSHCTSFKMEHLYHLIQKCPLIEEVDLTVDISPVIPSQVSVLSSNTEAYQVPVASPYGPFKNTKLFSNISKLTLEGRNDLTDASLSSISMLAGSISYINLKGCTSLTDVGITKLICQFTSIHSMVFSYTSFGRNSISVICPDYMLSYGIREIQGNNYHSNLVASRLQQLHLDGCKGIDHASMKHLMNHVRTLKTLSLKGTYLTDDAVYKFSGVSLENLDVSETMISVAALAYITGRNTALKSLKASDCRNMLPHDASCIDFYHELGKKFLLEEVAFGWGFSPFSLEKLKPAILELRFITVGLGASVGYQALSALPKICPLLESVIFHFQVISDSIVKGILESLRYLQVLGLCCCLGDFTSQCFQISMPNIRTLRLEWVTPWMTNDDLVTLTRNSPNLVEFSLSGCKLLDPDSQQIISSGWPGLTCLHLEDCGNVMSNGASSIFNCKALEDILLRHSGRGIRKNFIVDAASKLPLLRKIALDLCDACEGGLDTPIHAGRFFLSTVKISCCKADRCAFDLQRLVPFRPVHKETIALEWNSKEVKTTILKERV